MAGFLSELKRRNVVKVGVAYAVVAWVLIEIASVILPGFGAPEWTFQVFTSVVLLGFPLAVIFAWAFELTPEGLKREKEVDRSKSITTQTGRKLDFAIIALLVVALGISITLHFGGRQQVPETGEEIAITDQVKTIAVLPFVNMSADPDNEYFSDGIAEELLNVLVRVEGLKVSSRTSSFAFKDREATVPEIANQLNVDHILEGSVRKAGTKVRITAQLIDVKSDTHLWSDTYDRELEDIFAIQDEIAGNIVQALKVALGTEAEPSGQIARQPTDNLEAYQVYLQGRHLWQQRGGERLTKSIELLQQAIALDPGFARAHSTLAAAYGVLPGYIREATSSEYVPLADESARRAIALDATLAEPHAVLGLVAQTQFRWSDSESEFRKAIELDPLEPTSYFWLGLLYVTTGRVADGLVEIQHSLELNPVSELVMGWLAYVHYMLEQDDQAWPLAQRAAIPGGPTSSWGAKSALELRRGDFDASRDSWLKSYEVNGVAERFVDAYYRALQNPERRDEAVRVMAEETAKDSLLKPAWEYRYLAAYDRAYDFMIRGVEEDNDTWLTLLWEPESKTMRQNPRFKPIVEEYGLVDYWRATKWADLCRPVGDDDFECD